MVKKQSNRDGYLKKITDGNFNNLNRHRFPNDCCPCVMSFFGDFGNIVDQLFETFGTIGMNERDIEQQFEILYPNYRF